MSKTTTSLVTLSPQQPFPGQHKSNQEKKKNTQKINEVLHCPLALQEQHEEEVRTLSEPCTKASTSPPSPCTPTRSLAGTVGYKPCGRAGWPCQHPAAETDLGHGPTHNKRLLSRETAGQEKTRAGRM